MRRLITVLLLILAGGQFYNNYAQFTEPSITFDKTSYNFGNINELDGLKTTVFGFKNNGSQPLILLDITSTCGCTVPEWNKEPIPPGGTGKITVTYDPLGRPGAFRKSIAVKSNARESLVNLYIVGLVAPRPKSDVADYIVKIGKLRLLTNHLSMRSVYTTRIKVDSIQVYNDSDSAMVVTVANPPAHLTFEMVPPMLEPKKKGTIMVTFDPNKINDWGFVIDRVVFKLNGVAVPSELFAISANIEEDFSLLTADQKKNAPRARLITDTYNFGTITPGQIVAHDFTLKNEGKYPLIIRKITTTCGCTALKPDKMQIQSGESITLKCTFDSREKTGRQLQTVNLIVNDPNQSTLIVRFLGEVQPQEK